MRAALLAAALLLPATISHAQQIDAVRLLPVLEQQRNMALNLQAQAEALLAQQRDENVKLKAELEDLRKKLDEKK